MRTYYHQWEAGREYVPGTNPGTCVKCGTMRRRRLPQKHLYEYRLPKTNVWTTERPNCVKTEIDPGKVTPLELFLLKGRKGDVFYTSDHTGSIKIMLEQFDREAIVQRMSTVPIQIEGNNAFISEKIQKITLL